MIDDPISRRGASTSSSACRRRPARSSACCRSICTCSLTGVPAPHFVGVEIAYVLVVAFLMASRIPHFSGKSIGRVPRECFVACWSAGRGVCCSRFSDGDPRRLHPRVRRGPAVVGAPLSRRQRADAGADEATCAGGGAGKHGEERGALKAGRARPRGCAVSGFLEASPRFSPGLLRRCSQTEVLD